MHIKIKTGTYLPTYHLQRGRWLRAAAKSSSSMQGGDREGSRQTGWCLLLLHCCLHGPEIKNMVDMLLHLSPQQLTGYATMGSSSASLPAMKCTSSHSSKR